MASATLDRQVTAKPQATYADLEAVPVHLIGEILEGALYTHRRPAPKHARVHTALASEIFDAFERGRSGPGGWTILIEPELHLGQEVVVPDIAGWRRENLSALPDTAHIETAPDWICEVTSPSTERRDRNVKRSIYGAAGVGFYWLLDPRAEMLETFVLQGSSWMVGATFVDDAEVRTPPFEAITFPLPMLWPLPMAGSPEKDDE